MPAPASTSLTKPAQRHIANVHFYKSHCGTKGTKRNTGKTCIWRFWWFPMLAAHAPPGHAPACDLADARAAPTCSLFPLHLATFNKN